MPEHLLSSQVRSGDEAVRKTLADGTAAGSASPFLKVAAYPAGERTVVVVAGELDIDTEQALQRALREALARSVHGLDLDFAGVDFCDCSGLNVLLHIRRLARAEAKTVRIQTAGLAVERLLTLTRTGPFFAHPDGAGPGMAAKVRGMRTGTNPSPVEEDGLPEDVEESLRTEIGQLKRAMLTRPVIDLARGVLMASFGLNAEDAWSVLVETSQRTNTKLHHLAQELVGAVNGAPLPDRLRQQVSEAVTETLDPLSPNHRRHDWTSPSSGPVPPGGDSPTP
ncbi:ANTAR domain-containing protein [Streptomyces sp. NBC_01764]|uniref:ANTAR domain-containing protein n=1 Tax=Streptomyces sp. NBC_01764 TaxID=2975935 RepID=UPI002256C5C0|nr:ANTAR domain-containing protein [Streptomyces sp. NBC_01764]MCX4404105.1 ANTAR domain-containing protein [Streptomyces sp. NBC_01764]